MLSYRVDYNKDKECFVANVMETIEEETYVIGSHECFDYNEADQWIDEFVGNWVGDAVSKL
jgi:hypothetical protein